MCTLGTDAALLRSTARAELGVAREGGGGVGAKASSPYG
jgi:hypothetical protein